jgi:hypothetical protein
MSAEKTAGRRQRKPRERLMGFNFKTIGSDSLRPPGPTSH